MYPGRPDPFAPSTGAREPAGSPRAEAASPQASQCVKPPGMGASGSCSSSAKERVRAGGAVQRRGGETFSPRQV